ncbi:MAG TPA: helix-turn-helix domain-containing protein [Solirubrobacterales bacterium]|nr:helix-turn-helix domain-containing protein [Solirubrobacterales bacterium]
MPRGPNAARLRAALAARLGGRAGEIEEAVRDRVYSIADPLATDDPEYAAGLPPTISAAVEYACRALGGEGAPPPVPTVLLAQARLAARCRVPMDDVMRRYVAGNALLVDFLIEEAAHGGVSPQRLKGVLRPHATLLDDLMSTLSQEYQREVAARPLDGERRRARCVERLLAGELIDTAELAYPLEAWHLAAIARGPFPIEALSDLARRADCRLLAVGRGDSAWIWLASRHPHRVEEIPAVLLSARPSGTILALGEAAEGVAGWRLSHRQARAALLVAVQSAAGTARYAEVALLASIQHDDLLAASLQRMFLAPLDRDRDGGENARRTLRAYFMAERNSTSAAATLGVSRNTVAKRLREIEAAIGRPLSTCAPELEAALRLEDLRAEAAELSLRTTTGSFQGTSTIPEPD